ncbi:DUF6541 family protein [Arthrobacter flavus]|uniref:DUF6541 family protein n=1 Tax=Arthrobacter flavus TaxID=95172 RepID=A0ABW4QBB6_9MICC
MTWWQAAPTILSALALMFIPGYLIARSCGSRGITAGALASPLTISVIALGAIAADLAGVTWSLWVLIAPVLLLSVGGISIRLLWRRTHPTTHSSRSGAQHSVQRSIAFGSALALAAVLIGWRLIEIIAAPDNVSQTYDAGFHLNALQFISDTGSASSLTLGGLTTNGADPYFYPAAWHGFVSLLIQLTQASIPVAVTASTLVISAVVWPLGCMFLCTRITGNRPIPLLVTGALSAAFGAFPYLMLDFGVLYPNLLSIALLPTSIGLAAMVLRLSADNHEKWAVSLLGFFGTLPGLALAHPSTLMALLALMLPMGAVALVRHWRHLHHTQSKAWRYLPSVASLIVYAVAVYLLWLRLRPGEAASDWKPFQTPAQAFGEVLASAPQGRPIALMLTILVLAGILHVLQRKGGWWGLCLFIVTGYLFVVATAFPQDDYRALLTGVWYNDSFRLAALLPVTTIVIAVIGGSWLVTAFVARIQASAAGAHRSGYRASLPAVVALVIAIAVITVGSQGKQMRETVTTAQESYELTEDSDFLSIDERTLIERLPGQLPDDAVIAGNPWTGTVYAYALAGIPTLTPHVGSTGGDENLKILTRLDQAGFDPEICQLVETLNSYYVLDFAGPELHLGDHNYPGVEDLATKPGFQLLDSEGDATLYEVTAC